MYIILSPRVRGLFFYCPNQCHQPAYSVPLLRRGGAERRRGGLFPGIKFLGLKTTSRCFTPYSSTGGEPYSLELFLYCPNQCHQPPNDRPSKQPRCDTDACRCRFIFLGLRSQVCRCQNNCNQHTRRHDILYC